MARTIHEVLDKDRELYNEYRTLTDNPERLDEMAAIMEGCGYAAEYNLMRRSLILTRKILEFERSMR
jgi:hypothetical protein